MYERNQNVKVSTSLDFFTFVYSRKFFKLRKASKMLIPVYTQSWLIFFVHISSFSCENYERNHKKRRLV